MFKRPIAIGLSPNTESDDVNEAIHVLFAPQEWKNGFAIKLVERWFNQQYDSAEAVSFNSGRSAFFALLKTFGIGKGDEVIVQAFTCVAVPDPIIWSGAKAVFVDIDDSLNINPRLLEELISPKSKAIVVQHTFGIPADMELITKIAQKHRLLVIEDCSHALGSIYRGQKVGTLGDAAFFSFGRDKVLSSVFGGIAIINSPKLKVQSQKLRNFQTHLKYPEMSWILQQLLHPILFSIILPLYGSGIGKLMLIVFQRLQILSFPVYQEEKRGGKPSVFPARYPNALARLLLIQLKKLDRYNEKRRNIAQQYFDSLNGYRSIKLPTIDKEAVYLRFNIKTSKSTQLLQYAREKGVILGNWYKSCIDPNGVDFHKIGYKPEHCPKAEQAARLSVNLPTYPTLTEENLKKIIKIILNITTD